MAQQVVVKLVLDTESIRNALKRIQKFKTDAEDRLLLKAKINQTELRDQLRTAKAKIDAFKTSAQKSLNLSININVNASQVTALRNRLNGVSAAIAQQATQSVRLLQNQVSNLQLSLNKLKVPKIPLAPGVNTGAAGAANTNISSSLDLTRQSFFGFIAAASIGVGVLKQTVSGFIEFEDVLVKIGRLTQQSGEELTAFGNRLSKTASELGVSAKSFLELVEVSARLGVSRSNLNDFAIQVQKVAIALQLTGVEAAEIFRSFELLFKLEPGNITRIGNAFNAVADASSVLPSNLARFVQFLGPAANQFELFGQRGISLMTALGAVLAEVGVSSEVAGSGIQRIFTALVTKGDAAAKVAGITAAEFKNLAETDITAALEKVIVGFNKLNAAGQATAKAELGLRDIRVSRVFTLLAGNLDRVKQKQDIATQAFREGVSVETEVQRNLTTLSAQFAQTANEIQRVVNEALGPYIQSLKDALSSVRDFVRVNPELAKELATVLIHVSTAIALFGVLATGAFVLTQAFNTLYGTTQLFVFGIGTMIAALAKVVPAIAGVGLAAQATNKVLIDMFKTILVSGGSGSALSGLKSIFAALSLGLPFILKASAAIAAKLAVLGGVVTVLVAGMVGLANAIEAVFTKTRIQDTGITKFFESLLFSFDKFTGGAFGRGLSFITNGFVDITAGADQSAHAMSRFRKETKDAADGTTELVEASKKQETAFKAITNSIERTGAALSALPKGSTKIARDFLASFDTTGDAVKSLKDTNTSEFFGKLAANGGETLRAAIRNAVLKAISEAGPQAGADLLNQLTSRIEGNAQGRFDIDIKANAENVVSALDAVEAKISSVAIGAQQVKLGDKDFANNIASFAAVVQAIDANVVGNAQQLNQQIAKIAAELRLSDEDTKTLTLALTEAGVPMSALSARTSQFRLNFENSFGVGGLKKLDLFSRGLLKIKDDIAAANKGVAGFEGLGNVQTEEQAKAFALGLLNSDSAAFDRIERQVALRDEEANTQERLNVLLEEAARIEQKTTRGIQDRIDVANEGLTLLIKQRDSEQAAGKSTIETNEKIASVQSLISDLENKKAAKIKDTNKELERQAETHKEVEKILISELELDAKIAGNAEEVEERIRSQIRAEKERFDLTLSKLKEQKASELDLITARLAGTRKVAKEELLLRQQALEGAEKQAAKAIDALNKLQVAGQKFVEKLERSLAPSKVVEDILDLTASIEEQASQGRLARNGLEERTRAAFEQKIAKIRQGADQESTDQLERLADRRITIEERIAEIRLRLEEAANTRDLRGLRGDELERAQDQREKAARNLNRELSRSQRELADVAKDEARVREQSAQTQRALAPTLEKAGKELDDAFEKGRVAAKETEDAAKKAAENLQNAANALDRAAVALERIAGRGPLLEEKARATADATASASEQKAGINKNADTITGLNSRVLGEFTDTLTRIGGDVGSDTARRAAAALKRQRDAALVLADIQKQLDADKKITAIGTAEEEKIRAAKLVELNRRQADLKELLAQKEFQQLAETGASIEKSFNARKEALKQSFSEALLQAKQEGATLPSQLSERFNKIVDDIDIGQVAELKDSTRAGLTKLSESLQEATKTVLSNLKNVDTNLVDHFKQLDIAFQKQLDTVNNLGVKSQVRAAQEQVKAANATAAASNLLPTAANLPKRETNAPNTPSFDPSAPATTRAGGFTASGAVAAKQDELDAAQQRFAAAQKNTARDVERDVAKFISNVQNFLKNSKEADLTTSAESAQQFREAAEAFRQEAINTANRANPVVKGRIEDAAKELAPDLLKADAANETSVEATKAFLRAITETDEGSKASILDFANTVREQQTEFEQEFDAQIKGLDSKNQRVLPGFIDDATAPSASVTEAVDNTFEEKAPNVTDTVGTAPAAAAAAAATGLEVVQNGVNAIVEGIGAAVNNAFGNLDIEALKAQADAIITALGNASEALNDLIRINGEEVDALSGLTSVTLSFAQTVSSKLVEAINAANAATTELQVLEGAISELTVNTP